MSYRPKPATDATATVNREAVALYAMEDRRDFADADRGFIAPFPGPIRAADGRVIFDIGDFDYITDDARAPDTVNPSLWRQSQVMSRSGLYKVADDVYQVRNNDIANLTVVEGEKGLVVVDCTASVESARQAMAMIREHVGDKPVAAVIYTHTHIDHYGGIKGVVDPKDVASGKVPIVAPGTIASFDKHAIGENVIAGNAMSRRAGYAFGSLLGLNSCGCVTSGIGIMAPAGSTVSCLSPTDPVTKTGEKHELAGLEFEFLYAPDTEAPEEMHIWIPQLGALTCAENASHSLHNIQTLRGARTRDARNFARYLDETLERWGDQAQVHYGPHTWPVWGSEMSLLGPQSTGATSDVPAFDGAPRGTLLTYGAIADQLGAPIEDGRRFSGFVPTVSAIALDKDPLTWTEDLYRPAGDITADDVRLDDFRCARTNTEHGSVQRELVEWIVDRLAK